MKHLRQYIRQILLERAFDKIDILQTPDIGISIEDNGAWVLIEYVRMGKDDYVETAMDDGQDLGRIIIDRGEERCVRDDVYFINRSQAKDGYGPFLYDVAMEYATLKGSGLMSDRSSVSTDAQKVWQYYLNNRSDVEIHQMDNMENVLTPEEEDNCNQFVSQVWGGKRGDAKDWMDSPLSKRYTRYPGTINLLRDAGKLKEWGN